MSHYKNQINLMINKIRMMNNLMIILKAKYSMSNNNNSRNNKKRKKNSLRDKIAFSISFKNNHLIT